MSSILPLALTSILMLSGCVVTPPHPYVGSRDSDPRRLNIRDYYGLSEVALESLRLEAASGNGESSYKLSVYYIRPCAAPDYRHFFYLNLSAEQGYCPAIVEWSKLQSTEGFRLKDGFDWTARLNLCRRDGWPQ